MSQFDEQTRRQLLKDSMMAFVAAGCVSATSQAETKVAATRPKWTVACRDANLKEVEVANTWLAMDMIGVEGVEVFVDIDGNCPGLIEPDKKYSIADTEHVKQLGDAFGKHKKKITAFCLANSFDQQADKEIAFVINTAHAAVTLGVPALRLDMIPHKLKNNEDEFVEFCIKIARQIVKETDGMPVRFGVENHGGTTNKPEFLRKLFQGVGTKRFGLTLDTANFYWYGHPLSKLYEIYNEFAPWVCHTHCKSINYPKAEREKERPRGWEYAKYACPVYEGNIDFKRVLTILNENKYTGDLCIENESLRRIPKQQRRLVLAKEAAFLRKLTVTA